MHDTDFFKKLVENIVMWSIVAVFAALGLVLLVLPLYLAIAIDWKFCLLYLLYAVTLVMVAMLISTKGDEQ